MVSLIRERRLINRRLNRERRESEGNESSDYIVKVMNHKDDYI